MVRMRQHFANDRVRVRVCTATKRGKVRILGLGQLALQYTRLPRKSW
jgi:hypothetical protein